MIAFLLLAFILGCVNTLSKMINFRAAEELGTWNGSLVNYVVASILSFLILLGTTHFDIDWHAYTVAPAYLYLSGAFGIIAFILHIISLKKMQVFQATTLLLVGQLLAGILFDMIVFQNFTFIKLIGIILVAAGIIYDKKLTLSNS